jgi:hypothetical protein
VTRARKGKIVSELMDAEAGQKIADAAHAVGMTSEQLINLVADSGHLGAPPSGDGITELVTLEDLGSRLHALAASQPRSKRADWFHKLVPAQKSALITVLRERGYASACIAQDFDIAHSTVIETYNKHADALGANVVNTRLSTIAGHLQLAMERSQHGAAEAGDWSAYWRILKEFTAMLQSLGIVDRAAQKIEIDQHVSIGTEEKQAELRRILETLEKSQKRQLEIKLAEDEGVDMLPQDTDDQEDTEC